MQLSVVVLFKAELLDRCPLLCPDAQSSQPSYFSSSSCIRRSSTSQCESLVRRRNNQVKRMSSLRKRQRVTRAVLSTSPPPPCRPVPPVFSVHLPATPCSTPRHKDWRTPCVGSPAPDLDERSALGLTRSTSPGRKALRAFAQRPTT